MNNKTTDQLCDGEREIREKLAVMHPSIEVHRSNWSIRYDWNESVISHLRSLLIEPEDHRKVCPECGGSETERVIKIYTRVFDWRYEFVNWPCRTCFGSGYILPTQQGVVT